MPVTTRIKEDQLASYFDQFTKRFLLDDAPEMASVEVLSLEFELESGDHRVYNPREVWVMEDKDGFIGGIEVVREDGEKEVVTIRRAPLR